MADHFRRPLGVFLQGGGALGAWQAAALEVLLGQGLEFKSVMGYSIGAMNGAALAMGRMDRGLAGWREVDGSVIRLSPSLFPFALFSPEPLRAFPGAPKNDADSKAALRADLTLIVAVPSESRPLNARFTPRGEGGWEGPLADYVAASCSVPFAFPPVDLEYRGRRKRMIDGGIPMNEPLDLSPLAGCADVIVLEMIRADEVGRRAWTPWGLLDRRARRDARRLTDEGVARLKAAEDAPRVYRLAPSRRLEPMILDFRAAGVRRMLAQGGDDARAFLADPESRRA